MALNKCPVCIIFGPTASGKTALLEALFASPLCPGDKIPAEIISADSMQVYRGLDIGTAKASHEERRRIPHHLIDIIGPREQFNAGEFVRLAEKACLEAFGRSALPVVSGGTGFYLMNLVQGLSEAPPADENIRRKLREELRERGAESLLDELAKLDPISAGRIHVNDEYRLLRALEVCRLSGLPLSSFNSAWSGGQEDGQEEGNCGGFLSRDNFNFLLIGLKRNREELYRRINERTSAMFKAGLYREVKALFEEGLTPADPGLRAIGYREFFVEDYNEAGTKTWRLSEDLAGLEALIAQNSRRYAKRQITFFSSLSGVKWIDCGDFEQNINEIRRLINEFMINTANKPFFK